MTRRRSAVACRTLTGTIGGAGSGAKRMEVAVARKVGSSSQVLRGTRFREATKKAFLEAYRPATIQRRAGAWSLRLPRPAAGTYLLRIRGVDRAGNASGVLEVMLRLR